MKLRLRKDEHGANSSPRLARRWTACVSILAAWTTHVAGMEQTGFETQRAATFVKLPLHFEANRGQAEDSVKFLARGRDSSFLLSATEATIVLRKRDAAGGGEARLGAAERTAKTAAAQTRTIHMRLLGANAQARGSGLEALTGTVNYFLGNDPAKWRTEIPIFACVEFSEIYHGVDLAYHASQQELEYDFVIAPGADPKTIAFRVEGADRLKIGAQGELILQIADDQIRHHQPVAYQVRGDVRKEIRCSYRIRDAYTVGFELGDFNPTLPLVIDPILSYSTYLGGSRTDTAWAVTVDTNGYAYVAGETLSSSFAVTNVAAQTNFGGGGSTMVGGDAFVAKLDPSGSSLVYLSYIGGRTDDGALAIAIDGGGNAYITGFTDSTNFPLQTPLPTQSAIHGKKEPDFGLYPLEAFVTKLNAAGSALLYSTYLGGNTVDEGVSIAVDSEGNAYVTGFTDSTNFPTFNSGQNQLAGGTDAFVTKISSNGSSVVYSTYLGGTNTDRATGIAVDGEGRAFITGLTASTNFPVLNAAQPKLAGGLDAFVTVLDAGGSNLVSSTYLGGREDDIGFQIAVDSSTNIFVTGSKTSSDFPVTPGNLDPGGVFKSDDAAASWSASNNGLFHTVVTSLAIDPATPTRLYAGTGRGVARSSDGGATWETAIGAAAVTNGFAPAIAVDSVVALAIDPSVPSTVYAGTLSGVFKSIDAGTNWTLSNTGLVNTIDSVAIDPLSPSNLYAGTDSGVFKSTNGAANWTSANSGLANLHVRALIVDPLAPATVYAGTAGGVFRSTNSGANWSARNSGLSNLLVLALAVDPVTPSTLYSGTAVGVFKSVNAGTNWSIINAGLSNHFVNAIAIDPTTPATIYAGTFAGLFKSIDGGSNWNFATNGLAVLAVAALAVNPSSPATLYCGTFGVNSFGGTDAFLAKLGSNTFFVVFGGVGLDEGWDLAVDSAGNAYVVGVTTSTNFPTAQAQSLQTTNAGGSDAFVSAISADGSTLLYSTYLGGKANDFGFGIDVDAAGSAYIVGKTVSTNFPTRGALQPAFAGAGGDAFVAKIQMEIPTLSVAQSGADVVIAWRAPAVGFVLESTDELSPPATWTPVSQPVVLKDGFNTVTVPAASAQTFFRLRRQ